MQVLHYIQSFLSFSFNFHFFSTQITLLSSSLFPSPFKLPFSGGFLAVCSHFWHEKDCGLSSPSLEKERVWSPHNPRRQEKGQQYSSAVSTDLSLSTGFQSKSKNGDSETSRKQSGKRKSKPKMEKNKGCCNEEMEHWGYSTKLNLYEDPWKIKKVLTESDLGKMNRLLLGRASVENLMLPVLGPDAQRDVETEKGTPVRVRDVDTMSMHQLVLKRWASLLNYVFIGNWSQDFVKRRGLKTGDEIGLHWNSDGYFFDFSVLKRTTKN